MREIAQQFHKQGLRWVLLDCPEPGIWVQRSDRLMALLTLGKLGYRIISQGKDFSEYNTLLGSYRSSAWAGTIRLLTSLRDFEIQGAEPVLWERRAYVFESIHGATLPRLSVLDHLVFLLMSLKFQTEKTMEHWCELLKRFQSARVSGWDDDWLSSQGPRFARRLLKSLQIASSMGVVFPEGFIERCGNLLQGEKPLDIRSSI